MSVNRIRAAWGEGRAALGVWLAMPGPAVAEFCADPGLDYACVDQQHGLIGYPDLVGMLPAIERRGVAPITRVPSNDPTAIAKALDAGAQGIVIPFVSTPEEASRAVEAFRYPPRGQRSYGPIRAALSLGTREPDDLSSLPVCMVMVETREGLANAEAIAATDGVDGIYVGPADLAIALGLPPDLDKSEPEHVAAVETIRKACVSAGKVAGIQCGNGRSANRYAEEGFGFITVTKDSALLTGGVSRELAAARGDEGSGEVAYT